MPRPPSNIDWNPIKDRFVNSDTVPTYESLSAEFSLNLNAIRTASRNQGWALLRTKRTAALIERTGVHEQLLAAASMQQAVTDKFSNVTVATIDALTDLISEIEDKELAVSTRIGLLNTASFAVANLARALKDAGVVGLPKALMDKLTEKMPEGPEGKEYLRSALQQINITVQAAKEGKSTEVVIEPNREATPAGGIHRAEAMRVERIEKPDTPAVTPEELKSRSKEAMELRRLMRDAARRSKASFEVI